MNHRYRRIAAAVIGAGMIAGAAGTAATAGTPEHVKRYVASISGTQAVLSTPDGPVTISGCIGRADRPDDARAFDGESQDCRDLAGTQRSAMALMARHGATAAVLHDIGRDGEPLAAAAARWTRDPAADRGTIRYYAVPGGPWSGYGEWSCDAAGDACRLVHKQRLTGRSARRAAAPRR